MKLITLLFLLTTAFAYADSNVIDFHIASGTKNGAWNTQDTMVQVRMGQIVHFINDDSVVHRLHTDGAPCEHGPEMKPGATWDCVVKVVYDSEADGALYDHGFGQRAKFWIKATD
ncbi:MAG: hypothetical protein AABZ55_13260 [Bdellovibrionota bacterium]